jgi:predicted O-methyltransferase YrrM
MSRGSGSLWKALTDPHYAVRVLDRKFTASELRRIKAGLREEEERERSLVFLSEVFKCDAEKYLREYRESDFRKEFLTKAETLAKRGKTSEGSSSAFDCETLYLVVRACKPLVAVETGVLYGAFSSHVLEAMDRNGDGRLISLDLPSAIEGDLPKNFFVREEHRPYQRMVLGDTKSTLLGVLEEEGEVDLFNHDSLHTFDHMMWEYLTAHSFLSSRGVLTSHDVLSTRFHPNAFGVFVSGLGYRGATFRNFGVAAQV